MSLNDSPEATATMSTIPDPRVHARYYFKNPPTHALAVDEPWWWALLALGSGIVNVHFECNYRGPIAIVSRGQGGLDRQRDTDAICAILRAEGRPSFDAYRCPYADGKVVGLVNVVDCVDDPPTSWFIGPYGLVVDQPCLLPIGPAGSMPVTQGLMQVTSTKRDAILYALTGMANGTLQPGAPTR